MTFHHVSRLRMMVKKMRQGARALRRRPWPNANAGSAHQQPSMGVGIYFLGAHSRSPETGTYAPTWCPSSIISYTTNLTRSP